MTTLRTEGERNRWLAFAAVQPLPLDVECKPHKPKRSDSQNAYLWGVSRLVALGMMNEAIPRAPRKQTLRRAA